jgi:uncharacterized protein (DUF1778 family)
MRSSAAANVRDPKSDRLDVRLSTRHKALIEEAAALAGQPVSAFAVTTLVARAEQVVEQHMTTVLSARNRAAFAAMLDDARPNAALRRAARRFKARNA